MIYALLLIPTLVFSQTKPESFIIQLNDQNVSVLSPETKRNMFTVIVENKSMTDQVGKFIAGSKIIKFISVKAGKNETVEIENKTSAPVTFIPVSPAFQEVPLLFGKKAYEIPSKE